jgi:hypothetical protein
MQHSGSRGIFSEGIGTSFEQDLDAVHMSIRRTQMQRSLSLSIRSIYCSSILQQHYKDIYQCYLLWLSMCTLNAVSVSIHTGTVER